jgi:hypothetical protein
VTALERFMRLNIVLGDGCWLWIGSTSRGGYGQFNDGTTMVRAHRFGYTALVGDIPQGLDLDHLCRNRWCVNPEHLEPVTRGENLRRGYLARGLKGACAQGHPFDDDNTFQRASGGRGCRTCRNNASRASKARDRATTSAA